MPEYTVHDRDSRAHIATVTATNLEDAVWMAYATVRVLPFILSDGVDEYAVYHDDSPRRYKVTKL